MITTKNRDMKAIDCADYDSMGNQGRFPMKTKKIKPSMFDDLIQYLIKLTKGKK